MMHPDFAFISQAHVAPIVRCYHRHAEPVGVRFEIATGIVEYQPRAAIIITPEELAGEPAAPVKATAPHPRSLPDDHPDHIAWAAKVSASKLGKSIGTTGRKRHVYAVRACRCCPSTFAPTTGNQYDCHTCVARVPWRLRHAPTRVSWSLSGVRGMAKRVARRRATA